MRARMDHYNGRQLPPSAVRGSVGVVTMHQTQHYAFQRVLTQHQRRVQRRVILKVAGVIAGLLTAFLALGQMIP
jgi:hypothetical protein